MANIESRESLPPVEELPPLGTVFAQFERNLVGHRQLDPDLKHVDLLLQIWAPWARPTLDHLGYPTRAVTERASEGGILAKDVTPTHPPEWPQYAVIADIHVARLPNRHMAAIMANYFHMALVSEERAKIYLQLAKKLARTRPMPLAERRSSLRSAQALGARAFKDDLDRARWCLKFALRL